MSAFAKVKTQVKDLNMLKKALDDLGMKYKLNAKNVSFWRVAPQDLDIYVDSHRLGFVKNGDGYDLVGDSDFQKTFNRIRQTYSVNVAKRIAEEQGFMVDEVKERADGKITITARRQAYA